MPLLLDDGRRARQECNGGQQWHLSRLHAGEAPEVLEVALLRLALDGRDRRLRRLHARAHARQWGSTAALAVQGPRVLIATTRAGTAGGRGRRGWLRARKTRAGKVPGAKVLGPGAVQAPLL